MGMTPRISEGTCSFCNSTVSKATMTKHLKACKQREKLPEAPSRKKATKTFHLVVEGRYLPEYWLHLEVDGTATLEDLDAFLRDIWLECCGHLSAFTIEGQRYSSAPSGDLDDEDMDVPLDEVLRPGMKCLYEYDFGSTTELALKVIAERDGSGGREPVRLLARNAPPAITCHSCGKAASQVCMECVFSGRGWLCDACARKHKCEADFFLPVVNSPRVGTCAYGG